MSTALLPQVSSIRGLEIIGEQFVFPTRGDGTLAPTWGWAQHETDIGDR